MALPTNPVQPPPRPPGFGRPPGSFSGISQGNTGVFHYNPPEQHLVRGQVGILQNQNGQYMRQARQSGMELANARGLGDSSYAAGAAQRSAIDAALPIAAQDSETLTRIGLSNAEADQRRQDLELQKLINSASSPSMMMRDPDQDAERAHQLQLQRERLAFEGEQAGLGRGHEYGMGLFGLEGDLFGDQMGYDHARQMGYDEYGFDLGRMGAEYGYDLGRMGSEYGYDIGRMDRGYGHDLGRAEQGYGHDLGRMRNEFGYNSQLARLGADLGLRSDYYNSRWGSERDVNQINAQGRMNMYTQSILQGMQVQEFMENPEAFMGFIQYISGSQFDDIFGSMGGGRNRGRGR